MKTIMESNNDVGGLVVVAVVSGVLVLGVLILYYVLLVQAILQMLRSKVNQVLLTFALLSLVTIPPVFLLGVSVLIIWHFHKKDLPSTA